MVRRALVGDLNMLCKHAFLAGPCAGIRGIRGTLDEQVKSKERQRWERFRVNTSSVGNSMLQVLIGRDVVFSHASDATEALQVSSRNRNQSYLTGWGVAKNTSLPPRRRRRRPEALLPPTPTVYTVLHLTQQQKLDRSRPCIMNAFRPLSTRVGASQHYSLPLVLAGQFEDR